MKEENKSKNSKENIAFIDGQNLHLGTQEDDWNVDYQKFRIYLKDKYKVKIAYYFFGYLDASQQDLYSKLQESGLLLCLKNIIIYLKVRKKAM